MSETETPTTATGLPEAAVCLDFANTVGGSRERPRETLHSYADLVAWSWSAGLILPAEADRLLAAAAADPAAAAAVYARAIALREAIYRLFSAVAAGRSPAAADLAQLNAALATALGRLRVAPAPDGFAWTWHTGDGLPLDRPLWPLAHAAAALLTGESLDRVRECASPTCAWLFIDHSRNRSRRWCDMADCGNRAKARRHYERRRAARLAGGA
jgi:predicted RNA-binding Zn ribbon-like protein